MTSKQLSPVMLMKLIRPKPDKRVTPPAAERESVHPGNGSLLALAIMAGLKTTHWRFPLFLLSDFSAKFFVKVYVFGNPLMSAFSF